MTTETKSTENSSEVQIKKILVPIDGSEYSLKAANYAITRKTKMRSSFVFI